MATVRERVRRAVGEENLGRVKRGLAWATRSYVVLIVVGVILGLQVAPAVSQFAASPVQGTVAVVPLSGGINGPNAASVGSRLRQARQNPNVDAVVLRVNSGGGGASASEEIYTQVARTAEQMPVIVSVNAIAASGAYYSSAPADAIFVKPTSFVGSIGVFFVAPSGLPPINVLIQTGPNKLSGRDRRGWEYAIESSRKAFVSAVEEGRGERLDLSSEEVSYAKLYTGIEAVDNGLADRVGGLQDAVAAAADRAGLQRYDVQVIGYGSAPSFVTQTAYLASHHEDKEMMPASDFVRDPGKATVPNPLMLPPSVVKRAVVQELRQSNATTVNVTAANTTEVSANGSLAG
ncbi:MAG: S49 family peptidase [Halobacteriales archaeon]